MLKTLEAELEVDTESERKEEAGRKRERNIFVIGRNERSNCLLFGV